MDIPPTTWCQTLVRALASSIIGLGAQFSGAAAQTSDDPTLEQQTQEVGSDWRLGIGFGAISYPHYLGSDQRNFLALPFPYLEYYGTRFTYDDDGLVAKLFSSDRFKLNMSFSSALPVTGEDNRARKGLKDDDGEILVEDMDDLELILEAGPSLEITIKEWENSIARVEIPVRIATEIDFSTAPNFVGWTLEPKIHFQTERKKIRYELETGILYGSDKYQRIYYEVEPEFATPERPEYHADAGIMGWRFSLGARYALDQFRYFGYIRYFDLNSAANTDSPLLIQREYWSAGIGMAWMLKSSKSQ